MAPEDEARGAHLFRNLTLGEVCGGLGWAAVTLALVVLSAPLASLLFSVDGRSLRGEVARALEGGRLLLGATGLVLLALGRRARIAVRPSALRRGDAILLLATVLLVTIGAEIFLRVRGARQWGSATRTPLSLRTMRRDPEMTLRPGRYGEPVASDFDPAYRRFAAFTINRLGLRGPSASPQKAPQTRRVICLGGSTTFGFSVSDGEEWPAQLQKTLGSGFEVLNAGRPGSTTFRDFPYLRDRLLRLEPDVVVLYEGFNDMWRAVRSHLAEQPDYGIVAEGLPGGGGSLDLGPPRDWPRRPSFLTYSIGRWLDGRLEPATAPSPEASRGKERFHFDPPIVAMYEHNLKAMIRLCRRQGVPVLVLTFAGCDQASGSAEEQRRRLRYVLDQVPPLDVDAALEGMSLYREKTRQVAEEERVPFFDLAAVMTKDLGAYADTVHFTPRGEREVAEHVAAALRAQDLVAGAGGAPF